MVEPQGLTFEICVGGSQAVRNRLLTKLQALDDLFVKEEDSNVAIPITRKYCMKGSYKIVQYLDFCYHWTLYVFAFLVL